MWKFAVGDSAKWSRKDYDDSEWIEITAPCEWEWQGFPNLDGLCWYRKHLTLDTHLRGESLILVLGKINDMDEVFFNGVCIGRTGAFTPVDLQPHGTEIWQKTFTSKARFPDVVAPLVEVDEILLVAQFDGDLFGLDRQGNRLWTVRGGGSSAPALWLDQQMFVPWIAV